MTKRQAILLILLLNGGLSLTACHEADGPTLNVTLASGSSLTTDPFKDAIVRDIVFLVTSVAPPTNVIVNNEVAIAANSFLDSNGDGVPDTLAYPTTCDLTFVAGCGAPTASTSFDLAGLPLNFRYTLTIRFRDANGTILYAGTSTAFDNLESTSAVAITVEKAGP